MTQGKNRLSVENLLKVMFMFHSFLVKIGSYSHKKRTCFEWVLFKMLLQLVCSTYIHPECSKFPSLVSAELCVNTTVVDPKLYMAAVWQGFE